MPKVPGPFDSAPGIRSGLPYFDFCEALEQTCARRPLKKGVAMAVGSGLRAQTNLGSQRSPDCRSSDARHPCCISRANRRTGGLRASTPKSPIAGVRGAGTVRSSRHRSGEIER